MINFKVVKDTPVGPIPADWGEKFLEELSEFITKGATPTTYGFKWVDEGIPFLRSECVGEEGFSKSGLTFITEEANEALGRSKIISGDILISITGYVGRVAVYPKWMEDGNINQHIARVRINKANLADKLFIYYQLSQPNYRIYYNNIITGAAYPQLSLKQIRETPVFLPPLPTQRRIAAILSAYDDLIENNLKRIRLLEEAAQHIYREWFVHFRFPGHERVRRGADGLPEGWRRVPLEDLIEHHIGGGWGKDDAESDFVHPAFVIRGTDIPKLKAGAVDNVPYRFHTASNLGSRKLIENDIVFEVSGGSKGQPVGRSLLVTGKILDMFNGQDIICASFCKLIRIDSAVISPFYMDTYLAEIYSNGVLSQYENQSASNIINFKFNDFISKEQVIIPSKATMTAFDDIVQPLRFQIGNLGSQINRLKEARDTLLPRLMNRTIEV